ncbi:unnamed protein product [Protopolystoma xenopodis]|uniref:Uncharacterized protein n=1 Tax=Protopolystoma xenopodis TaxID=117903 RepID=A0A3S5CF50_9PLAT|nr:unnamed protein product [Protopolystoma xenopodis]
MGPIILSRHASKLQAPTGRRALSSQARTLVAVAHSSRSHAFCCSMFSWQLKRRVLAFRSQVAHSSKNGAVKGPGPGCEFCGNTQSCLPMGYGTT